MAINGGEEYDLTGVDLSAKTDDGEYDLTGIDLGEAESKKKTVSQPPLGGSPQPLQEAQDISATSASATPSTSAKTPFEQKPPYFVPEKLIVEGVPKEENLAREYEISQNNLVGAQKGVDWATGRDEELKGSLDPEARKSAGKYTQDAAIKLGQAQFKADENIAKLKEAIKGDLDYLGSNLENFTRKSQEDDVIADEVKIDEYAREQARKKGLPEDGYYKNFLYNNAKAEVAQKIIEPDVLKEREKLFKEKTGKSIEDAFGEDFAKGFTKAQEIEATAKTQINSVAQEVNALAKTEIEEIARGVNSQIEQLNAAYQQQASQVTDQSQADALHQQYTSDFNKLQANFLDAQNQINGKYNQRLRRQADEIEKVANQKFSEEAEKYKKDYKANPELLAQLKDVSQEAYEKVVSSKEKVKDVRDLYTPAWSNYARTTFSSLGRSLGNLSETVGYDYGKVLGDYMENTYQPGSAELNSWKDLLNISKVAKSAGQLTGAMLPSMGAAYATTIATGGLGAPEAVSMLAGGLAAWAGESMDMAGNIERETFAATGDANKALERSKRMWDAQMAIMPLYSLEMLPFMKGFGLSKNIAKRMAGGAAVEYVTEVGQEYTQNRAEATINADKEFSEIFDTASWKEFGHTALNVAPVAILGAGGQIRGEKSEQEKINDEAKSFALKTKFSEIAPDQLNQFMADMVSQKGATFTSAYISNLYTNGKIDKAQANDLVKSMGVAAEVQQKAKEYGFDETQQKVFTAFKFKLQNAQQQAANETDPILKQAAEAKVKELEEQTVNFASGKQADYIVMTYPNGEQYVLSVGQGQSAAKNPKLQQAVADGTIKLEGSGKGVDVVNLIGENIKQSKKQKDAKENQIGLPSEVGERQEPVKAEPIEEGRGTEVAPSGVLEKQEEKVGKKLIPEGETFIDVPKEDIVQAEDYFEKPVDEKLTSDMSIEQRIEMVDKNKDNIKDEEVKISDIIPTQNILDKRAIDKRKTDKEPVLIKWKGEYYVLDGHHRIVSDINGGKKSVKAKVIDFSEDVAGSKSDAMQQENTGNNAAPAQINEQHKQVVNELLNRQQELLKSGIKDFTADEKWAQLNAQKVELENKINEKETPPQATPPTGNQQQPSKGKAKSAVRAPEKVLTEKEKAAQELDDKIADARKRLSEKLAKARNSGELGSMKNIFAGFPELMELAVLHAERGVKKFIEFVRENFPELKNITDKELEDEIFNKANTKDSTTPKAEKETVTMLKSDGSEVAIDMRTGRKVTGTIRLKKVRDTFEVSSIAVNESEQRGGDATKLYEEAVKYAKSKGYKGVVSGANEITPAIKKIQDKFVSEPLEKGVLLTGKKDGGVPPTEGGEKPKQKDGSEKHILGLRIENSKLIPEEIREGLLKEGITYLKKSMKVSVKEASEIIAAYEAQGDLDALADYITNPQNRIVADVKVALEQELYKKYAEKAGNATTEEEKAEYRKRTVDILYSAQKTGAEVGRAVNMQKVWQDIAGRDPEGVVAAYKSEINERNKAQLAPHEKEIKSAFEQFQELLETEEGQQLIQEQVEKETEKQLRDKKRSAAKKELKDAWAAFQNVGFMFDPKIENEKTNRVIKALLKVIKEEAIETVEQLKEFIKKNLNTDIKDDDAQFILDKSKEKKTKKQQKTKDAAEKLKGRISELSEMVKNPEKYLAELEKKKKDAEAKRKALDASKTEEIRKLDKEIEEKDKQLALVRQEAAKKKASSELSEMVKNPEKAIAELERKKKEAEERKKKAQEKPDSIKDLENEIKLKNKLVRLIQNFDNFTEKQKKDIISDSLDFIIANGYLNEEAFRNIFAKSLGLAHITESDVAHIRSLAEVISKVEAAAQAVTKDNSPSNIKAWEDAIWEARKAGEQMNKYFNQRGSFFDFWTTAIRGSLLTTATSPLSFASNVVQTTVGMSEYTISDVVDFIRYNVAKINYLNKKTPNLLDKDRKIRAASFYAHFPAGFWFGSKEGFKQLWYGSMPENYMDRDMKGALHPLDNFARVYNSWTGKERQSFADNLRDVTEGIIGVPVETMFRILNLTDKPFRRGFERASLHELIDLDLIKQQQELEANKNRTPEESTLLQDILSGKEKSRMMVNTPEELSERAGEEGAELVMQDKHLLTTFIEWGSRGIKSALTGKKESHALDTFKGILSVIKAANFPYINMPANFMSLIIKYSNPMIPLVSAIYKFHKGSAVHGKPDIRGAQKEFSAVITAYIIGRVAQYLILNGLLTGADDDDSKEEREFKKEGQPPRTFNYSGFQRMLARGNPSYQGGDYCFKIDQLGVMGVVMSTYANVYAAKGKKAFEQLNEVEKYVLATQAGVRTGLDQSMVAGTNAAIDALTSGDERMFNRFITQNIKAVTAPVVPNTLTKVIAAADRDNLLKNTRDDKMSTWVKNNFKAQLGLDNDLPNYITIWGEKRKKTPEGRNEWVYQLFDFTKGAPTNRDYVASEIYKLWLKQTEIDIEYGTKEANKVLPSMPPKAIDLDDNPKIEKMHILTPKEYEELSILIGKGRKDLVNAYVNGSIVKYNQQGVAANLNWGEQSDEDKIKQLDKLYTKAYNNGIALFKKHQNNQK